MEGTYLEVIEAHVIPPLARVVLKYLTLEYTLTVEENKYSPFKYPDLRTVCRVVPLRGTFDFEYHQVIFCQDDIEFTYHAGWSLRDLPDYDPKLRPIFDDMRMATKHLTGRLRDTEGIEKTFMETSCNQCKISFIATVKCNNGTEISRFSEGSYHLQVYFMDVTLAFLEWVHHAATDCDSLALGLMLENSTHPPLLPKPPE